MPPTYKTTWDEMVSSGKYGPTAPVAGPATAENPLPTSQYSSPIGPKPVGMISSEKGATNLDNKVVKLDAAVNGTQITTPTTEKPTDAPATPTDTNFKYAYEPNGTIHQIPKNSQASQYGWLDTAPVTGGKDSTTNAIFIDENGAEYINPSEELVNSKNLTFATGTAPSWYESDPKVRRLNSENAALNQQLENGVSEIDQWKTTDAEVTQQVQDIKQKYANLIAQMVDTNTRRQTSLSTTGFRTGGTEYTASFGGAVAEEARQGIMRISELQSQEVQAIAAAKQAQKDQNWKVFSAKMDLFEKIQSNKQKELEDYNNKLSDSLKALQDQAAEEKKTENAKQAAFLKDKNDALLEARKGGATQEQIDAMNQAEDFAGVITAAGDTLQSAPGVAGEWLFAKRNGYTGSFIQYQNEDANRKVRVAAVAQNGGRILSTTEALALGVPFGTTAAEAYGKTITKPPTEAQTRDALFAKRVFQAIPTIEQLQSTITGYNSASFAAQSLAENTTIGNSMVDDVIKQVRQAERNFATAVLRRESGASISPTEFSTLEKQYFPRPGDDAKTLAQKKQARETVAKELIRSSGSAYGAEDSVPSIEQVNQDASDQIQQFYNSDPKNASLIDLMGQSFPDATPQEIIAKLKEKGLI